MSELLVSIISPTYRHATVLSDCIASVQAQTYPHWEQWIIDDGSDDETLAVAQRYANEDSRIHVLTQTHRGIEHLGESYNRALVHAQGDLVAILEGDDYWPRDKLATQVAVHTAHPDLLLSYGRVRMVRDGLEVGGYPAPPYSGRFSSDQALYWALTKQSFIMPVSVMIRHGVLDRIGGFQQTHGFPAVDYPTWLQIFQQRGEVRYLDQILGYWRQSTTQVTRVKAMAIAEIGRDIALDVFQQLSEEWRRHHHLTESRLLRLIYNRQLGRVYLALMRKALSERDVSQVDYCVRQLWRGTLGNKAVAILGYAAMRLGRDF